jgi:1-acyl-sn-glycerol-3-phosphate acyltransferase
MSGLWLLLELAAAWLIVVLIAWWVVVPLLRRGPDRDALNGLLWRIVRVWVRLIHRPTIIGEENLRRDIDAGPLVVVSNHTGAVDPFLIQSACRFKIRWMMALDMMSTGLDPLWRQQDMIRVARDGSDSGPARLAIRHVRAGGVLGIFPEGRIVTPPRQVWPFLDGVGLIVSRTKAPVLLAWVSQTPDTNQTTASLVTPSHARVEFTDVPELADCTGAAEITATLRRKLQELSGWPLNDDPPPPSREETLEPG